MEIPTGRFARRRRWLPPPATALAALEALAALARRAENAAQERGGDLRPEAAAPAASETGLNQAAVNQGPLPSDATERHRLRGGDLVDLTATVQVS